MCDCDLRWLARWLMSQPMLALFTECHLPTRLRQREIVELQEEDFVCHGKHTCARVCVHATARVFEKEICVTS